MKNLLKGGLWILLCGLVISCVSNEKIIYLQNLEDKEQISEGEQKIESSGSSIPSSIRII